MKNAFLVAVVLAFVMNGVAVAEPMLRILEPTPTQSLEAGKPISVLWDSNYGEDVSYLISYSRDNRSFSTEIASDVRSFECRWTPANVMDVRGWIKVKAFGPDGELKAEATTEVNFIPEESIIVSRANQKVFHFSNGALEDVFICSTALPQYDLDSGVYHVYSRQPKHWSRKYEVWMNNTLFFHEGYALHATSAIRQLGRAASHGCVRLHPRDAKVLYDKIKVGTPVIVLPKTKDCSFLLASAKPSSPKQAQTMLAQAR